MYKAAFWMLIFVTIISLVLQISGYDFLDVVIFLVVMDFIALWIYLEERRSASGIDEILAKKIDSIENACLKISEGINSVSSVLNLEEKVNKQREDINFMMEKINEKTFNLEEKINNFGQSLTSSLEKNQGTLDDSEEARSNIS